MLNMFLLFCYGVVMSQHYNRIHDIVWNGYISVFTLINIILLFRLSLWYKRRGIVGKLIEIISKNTLGIYVLHWIIQEIIKPFIPSYSGLEIIILSISNLIMSLCLALIINKIPLVNQLLLQK